MQETKITKSEQTRALILETALRLIRERGYEETTMRAIADEAGVALGNAYYYFRSKEDLVHHFYVRLQVEQFAAADPVLVTETTFKNRLAGLLRAQMGVAYPYQRTFVALFKIAADPENKLNAFHPATAEIRELCIHRYRRVVEESQEKFPPEMRAELPYLLWMYSMGIVLFWIYDRSPNCVRTYKLIELSSDLVANLATVVAMPIMAPLRKSIVNFLAKLREI